MASVARVPSWSITLIDNTTSSALMRGSLALGTTAETALAYVTALAGAVGPITGCVVKRVSVSYRIAISPLGAPTSGDSSTNQGVFIFHTNDDDKLAIVSLAGLPLSKLRSDGCFAGVQIDTDDGDIAALIDTVSEGIWSDPFGADIGALEAAYLRQVR